MEASQREKAGIAFFFEHAGYSYPVCSDERMILRERQNGAARLEAAEWEARDQGFTFEWEHDGMTNREWTDEGEEIPTFACICRNAEGKIVASLCGIDDSTNPYRRVVEAELALEALA